MGAVSSIEELADELRKVEIVQSKTKRGGWGKAALGALLSAAVSIGGTSWKVRGYIDKLEAEHAEQTKTLEFLRLHLPEVEKTAIDARADAQHVEKMLYAHLGGWPAGGVK